MKTHDRVCCLRSGVDGKRRGMRRERERESGRAEQRAQTLVSTRATRWTALKQAEKRDDDGDDEVFQTFSSLSSARRLCLLGCKMRSGSGSVSPLPSCTRSSVTFATSRFFARSASFSNLTPGTQLSLLLHPFSLCNHSLPFLVRSFGQFLAFLLTLTRSHTRPVQQRLQSQLQDVMQ